MNIMPHKREKKGTPIIAHSPMVLLRVYFFLSLALVMIHEGSSVSQSIFCRTRKSVLNRDYSFTRMCSISSSCEFSSKTLRRDYTSESSGVFWIGESVLQHSFLSLLNVAFGYKVRRHVLKNRAEYCTMHGTSLRTRLGNLNFFMIRSQGLYDHPVNDTIRWTILSKEGVTYKDQFIANDKYELSGCFQGKNLEEKIRTFFDMRKIKNKTVYVQLGLWDVCFSANDIDGFEMKLYSLLHYLKSVSNVFVGYMTAMHNSLPQHERRYNESIVGRVLPYNQVIKKVCHQLNIPVLEETYKLTAKQNRACIDGVHYDELTSIRLAVKIKKFICLNIYNGGNDERSLSGRERHYRILGRKEQEEYSKTSV